MENESDWKETQRLRIVEGHKPSGNLWIMTLLEDTGMSTEESLTGVVGLCGEGGVEGRLLSADRARLGADREEVVVPAVTGLVRPGEMLRLGAAGGVGDLYLELTSLVLALRPMNPSPPPLFLSDGTRGGLVVSPDDCLCGNFCVSSHKSIHTVEISPH